VDTDDERASRGLKKKKTAKKSIKKKQILSLVDKEEEGYTQRKSSALSMWYLPVIDRLHAILGNPKDVKLMS
jgi:hypothetical protein